jgi:hypothetical protein
MKKIITYILVFILNIGLYFAFSFLSAFVVFLLFGEGDGSGKYSTWVSLFFIAIQIFALILLYKKQTIVKDRLLLILNIIIVCLLFLYFSIYLPTMITY